MWAQDHLRKALGDRRRPRARRGAARSRKAPERFDAGRRADRPRDPRAPGRDRRGPGRAVASQLAEGGVAWLPTSTDSRRRRPRRIDRRRPRLGAVRADRLRPRPLARVLRAGDRPARAPSSTTARSALGVPGEARADRAARRQLRAAPEPPRTGPLPPGDPACRRGATSRSRWPAWPRRAGRSTAPPITWSARRSTCPIRTATGSRSIATARASEWRRDGGQLQMATLPLDLDDVLGELRGAAELQASRAGGTRIGHVHLQVSELARGRGVLPRRARLRRDGARLSRARCSSPPAATTTTSG